MTWYPDLGYETMIARGDCVRAVGWLHPNHPFPRGPMAADVLERLKQFISRAVTSIEALEALGWGITMGIHECEFCAQAAGASNFGVPGGDVLFVAPELIAHYVEEHDYLPPAAFIAALLAAPLPDSPEYLAAVGKFRQEMPP